MVAFPKILADSFAHKTFKSPKTTCIDSLLLRNFEVIFYLKKGQFFRTNICSGWNDPLGAFDRDTDFSKEVGVCHMIE